MSKNEENQKNYTPNHWERKLGELLENFPKEEVSELSSRKRKNFVKRIVDAQDSLNQIAEDADEVKLPSSIFDPQDPQNQGRLVAMALLAQDRLPLKEIGKFYGSGVYAIYYTGGFSSYHEISQQEHPIYIGKANPTNGNATNARDQGESLSSRLNEHLRNIEKAENLDSNDFHYRFLVVSSGAQDSAESHLIRLYKPVWNKEQKICHGLGKHGDAASTRGNKRSPWDTLHPGRSWAMSDEVSDQYSIGEIEENLKNHFSDQKIFTTVEEALDDLLKPIRQ